jgi:hypothetical protein
VFITHLLLPVASFQWRGKHVCSRSLSRAESANPDAGIAGQPSNACTTVADQSALHRQSNAPIGRPVPNVSATAVLVVLSMVGFYVAEKLPRRRVLHLANVKVLESNTPQRSTRWLHMPGMLLGASPGLLTVVGMPARHVDSVPGYSVAGICIIRRLPG